jgi:PAS domain S-box-containing protein
MAATNNGIWDWNVKTDEIYFDARYFTMAGYEPDAFPHKFEEWEKRVHPDDIENARYAIQKHLNGESSMFDFEFRFLRKDKKWMWIQGRGKAVDHDSQGNVVRMIGTHSDITERKQTEWTIQEMLSLYQTLDEKNYKEMLHAGLEIGIHVCESEIGYLHFVAPDEQTISLQFWSNGALKSCNIDLDNVHNYSLDESGVWADCVRLRKPVIHNDYQGMKDKCGLPKGHAPIKRHMSVPVFKGNKIVAIMGVGNKISEYSEIDSSLLSLVAGNIWNIYSRMQMGAIIKRKRRAFPGVNCKSRRRCLYSG